MSKENVETVRRCVEAWNRGDVDAFVESFHPEGEWFSEIVGRMEGAEAIYHGREAIRRFWDEYHSVWDLSVQISEYRDLGEKVLALGRMRTRGQASAVELESPVAYVGEFDHGSIRKLRSYLNPSDAFQAVGLRQHAADR